MISKGEHLRPWVEATGDRDAPATEESLAQRSEERRNAIAAAAIGEPELQKFCESMRYRTLSDFVRIAQLR